MLLPSVEIERVGVRLPVCQQSPLQDPRGHHDRKHLVVHRASFQSAAVRHPPHLSVQKKSLSSIYVPVFPVGVYIRTRQGNIGVFYSHYYISMLDLACRSLL